MTDAISSNDTNTIDSLTSLMGEIETKVHPSRYKESCLLEIQQIIDLYKTKKEIDIIATRRSLSLERLREALREGTLEELEERVIVVGAKHEDKMSSVNVEEIEEMYEKFLEGTKQFRNEFKGEMDLIKELEQSMNYMTSEYLRGIITQFSMMRTLFEGNPFLLGMVSTSERALIATMTPYVAAKIIKERMGNDK